MHYWSKLFNPWVIFIQNLEYCQFIFSKLGAVSQLDWIEVQMKSGYLFEGPYSGLSCPEWFTHSSPPRNYEIYQVCIRTYVGAQYRFNKLQPRIPAVNHNSTVDLPTKTELKITITYYTNNEEFQLFNPENPPGFEISKRIIFITIPGTMNIYYAHLIPLTTGQSSISNPPREVFALPKKGPRPRRPSRIF